MSVLLHACCAPCSSAIVECMLRNGMKPTVYFSNSNIYPQQEFDIRKHELMRFLEAQQVPYVEDEYDHEEWLATIVGIGEGTGAGKPLLGVFPISSDSCCQVCPGTWIPSAYHHAGFIEMEEHQADRCRRTYCGKGCPDVEWWDMNWRKGGLQNRRGELLKQNEFYNQLYCGCEFSMR